MLLVSLSECLKHTRDVIAAIILWLSADLCFCLDSEEVPVG